MDKACEPFYIAGLCSIHRYVIFSPRNGLNTPTTGSPFPRPGRRPVLQVKGAGELTTTAYRTALRAFLESGHPATVEGFAAYVHNLRRTRSAPAGSAPSSGVAAAASASLRAARPTALLARLKCIRAVRRSRHPMILQQRSMLAAASRSSTASSTWSKRTTLCGQRNSGNNRIGYRLPAERAFSQIRETIRMHTFPPLSRSRYLRYGYA